MLADRGTARCPACGRIDAGAATMPLFAVAGASGSGKTAIFTPLARLLGGRCVTFDVDVLLDSAGALSGGRPIDWAAFRAAWLAIAHGVAQGGLPTLMLGPLIPAHLEELPGRQWVGEIHYLLLDCADDVRRRRIEARPPWRARDINEQLDFARWLRDHIADQVDTGSGTPDDAAAAVAAWTLGRLAAG
jgi:hypothetical protein